MGHMLQIRHAHSGEVPLILTLIHRKAEFDRQMGSFIGELRATEEKLQATLFGEPPLAYVLLVEQAHHKVGFALYYFRYSSYAAQPSLWLDDLFLDIQARGQGIGTQLMQQLAAIAHAQHCTHMAWNAHPHNDRGIKFYLGLGAKIVERNRDGLLLELQTEAMQALTQKMVVIN